ncbi:hypothetical protein Tco_1226715 [Tanacetum coccineum]
MVKVYADDAIFMGQWCDGNISTLIHVLECFYRASGLRINMSKCKILGVNVDSDKVKGVASKLGCLILKTLFTYLGTKVGGSMSRVHAWNEAIHGDDGNVGGHVKSGAKSCWGGVEQDQFNELSALVHDVSLIPMSDRWKWDLESSGDFSVASVRKIIDDKSLSDVDSKTRWIKYVPIKAPTTNQEDVTQGSEPTETMMKFQSAKALEGDWFYWLVNMRFLLCN